MPWWMSFLTSLQSNGEIHTQLKSDRRWRHPVYNMSGQVAVAAYHAENTQHLDTEWCPASLVSPQSFSLLVSRPISHLRGSWLKLGVFPHLIPNGSRGVQCRGWYRTQGSYINVRFGPPEKYNKTQWFMKLCFHGNHRCFIWAGRRRDCAALPFSSLFCFSQLLLYT